MHNGTAFRISHRWWVLFGPNWCRIYVITMYIHTWAQYPWRVAAACWQASLKTEIQVTAWPGNHEVVEVSLHTPHYSDAAHEHTKSLLWSCTSVCNALVSPNCNDLLILLIFVMSIWLGVRGWAGPPLATHWSMVCTAVMKVAVLQCIGLQL